MLSGKPCVGFNRDEAVGEETRIVGAARSADAECAG